MSTSNEISTVNIGSMSLPKTIQDYKLLDQKILSLPPADAAHVVRIMGMADTYFLLSRVLSTRHWKTKYFNVYDGKEVSVWDHPWMLARCRDVQFGPTDVLRIWARYHFKSTIRFGENIRGMLHDPNSTTSLFSVTKQVADRFILQVKTELETNSELIELYPDRLHHNPSHAAVLWTVEKGFTIKRDMVLQSPTLVGYGLTDSSFTGSRSSIQDFDDAVNEMNVTTAEMIQKTIDKWTLALNTGFPGTKRRYIGTFYAYGDPYHEMAKRGLQVQVIPCYDIDSERTKFDEYGLPIKMENTDSPTLYTREWLENERRLQGPKTFGVQMLCNPQAGHERGFKYENLRFYDSPPSKVRKHCNVIILVDPANDKKKTSSRTAMWVIGLGVDRNYYVLDLVLDRLNLQERTAKLFDLVRRWQPMHVRYERYSFQADIQHIRYVMEHENYRFNIVEVKGSLSKDDRIERLVPLFKDSKIWMPKNIMSLDSSGDTIDLIDFFVKNEYMVWPTSKEKDGLDSLSRLCEQDVITPWPGGPQKRKRQDAWRQALYSDIKKTDKTKKSWMAA